MLPDLGVITLFVPERQVMQGKETASVTGTEWIETVQWSLQKYPLMVKIVFL